MNRYKKLVCNTAILGLGKMASKLIVLLLTPLYTAILSPEQFGTADILAQTANLIIPIACIGICDGIFRFAMDADNRKTVFSTGLCLLMMASAATACLVPLLGLFDLFEGYVALVGAYVLSANFHSLLAQYLRAKGKTTLFAVQGIINTALTVLLNLLFLLVFDMGVLGYVLSVVVADATVAVCLFLFAGLWRDFSPRAFSKQSAKELLAFSIPYIPTAMLWLVTSVSDRYIVRYYSGAAETGLYTAAYKIPTLLSLLCGVFIEAWQLSAVKDATEEQRSGFFGKVYASYMGIIFLIASGLIAFCRVFTNILLADAYADAWQYIPLLVLATAFSALVSFMGSVYFVEKKSVYSMMTSLAGAVVNVILNFVLIPEHGAMGAALATVISYVAVYAIRAIDTRSYVRFSQHTLLLLLNTCVLCLQIAVMLLGVRYRFYIALSLCAVMALLNLRGLWDMAQKLLPTKKVEKN
ncbi:MAG: hypothetical protein E7664_02355 [Ruminococcaceae bacterium]|nr:hypothetical protein [Oscillospiraceae bacterium]